MTVATPRAAGTAATSQADCRAGCSMARYLVFAGPHYYPAGGWDDLIGRYDTLAEAETAAVAYLADGHSQGSWAQVVDAAAGAVIWDQGNERPGGELYENYRDLGISYRS